MPMMTYAWKTKDGRFFNTEREAVAHENADAAAEVVHEALVDAKDAFMCGGARSFERAMAAALFNRGFTFTPTE